MLYLFSLKLLVLVWSFSGVLLFCCPVVSSPSGSSVHGVSQARILEWVAISFSKGSSPPKKPGIETASLNSPAFQADSLLLNQLRNPGVPLILCILLLSCFCIYFCVCAF